MFNAEDLAKTQQKFANVIQNINKELLEKGYYRSFVIVFIDINITLYIYLYLYFYVDLLMS